MENMTQLGVDTYVVRTQAGYRRALRDWKVSMGLGDIEVISGPDTYPSLVSFYIGYAGYDYVGVTTVHLNKIIDYIENVDAKIKPRGKRSWLN